MDRSNVLHQDAPHHHDHGQPTVDRMAPDEFHIAWSKEIEHHRGRNVPEVQLIVQPETPVDGNLSEEINPVPRTSAMKTGYVEEAGDDEPDIFQHERVDDRGVSDALRSQTDAAHPSGSWVCQCSSRVVRHGSRVSGQCYVLSEVMEHAPEPRFAISSRYGSSFWVRAEMIKLNHYPYSGHAFPDLIEKKDEVIVAQMRAVIWNGDFKRINEKFLSCGIGALSDGVSILFRATIMYDEFHGLSLRIIDIDTSFTLGELEKQRINCIERLKAEKIYNLNKSKQLVSLPKRFAVISVESSKGY